MPFSTILSGLGGGSVGVSRSLVSGAGSLLAASSSRKTSKLQKQTNNIVNEINVRRTARQVRYQQGLANVSRAASGGTQHGSFLFTAADNARQGAERVEDERLRGAQRNIATDLRKPSRTQAGVNFVGSLAGSIAKQNASNFRAS